MIVDTSALISILFKEPDAKRYAELIAGAANCRISAVTYVETAIVVERGTGGASGRHLDEFLRRAEIIIEPVTEEQAFLARQAHANFGKGRHRAGLNIGDCFAYALAKATGEPLLFKGHDFGHTDVKRALD